MGVKSPVYGKYSMFYISDLLTYCTFTGENNEDTEFLYYMNEGVYGPFSRKLLGKSIAAPSVHKVSRPPPKRVNPIQN